MGNTIPSRDVRFLIWLGVVAVAGAVLAAFMAWRTISIDVVDPAEAFSRFAEVRGRLGPTDPVFRFDERGGVTRRPLSGATRPRATRLHVMAYLTPVRRLATADSPFWFLKMKGPGAQFAFRDTGFDLERLEVTPAELEALGACLILDEAATNGDRLMVWTQ